MAEIHENTRLQQVDKEVREKFKRRFQAILGKVAQSKKLTLLEDLEN